MEHHTSTRFFNEFFFNPKLLEVRDGKTAAELLVKALVLPRFGDHRGLGLLRSVALPRSVRTLVTVVA